MAKPPADVRKFSAELYRGTRVVPQVDALPGRSWRVTVASDRVVMTGVFVPVPGRGHMAWTDSTLTVDGVQVPVAEDVADLARIIADPDTHRGHGETGAMVAGYDMSPVEDVPLEPVSAEEIPPQLRELKTVHATLVRVRALAPAVAVGRAGDMWGLDMVTGRGALRLRWRRTSPDRDDWWCPSDGGVRVEVDGVDVTDEVQGDVNEAILRLTAPGERPAAPVAIGRSAAAARQQAVMVRRASVMRV